MFSPFVLRKLVSVHDADVSDVFLSAYCIGTRGLLRFWRSINRLAQKNQYNREDIFQKENFTCWLGTGQRFVYGYYDIINNKTMKTKLVRTYFFY